jgi:hypothetical protein
MMALPMPRIASVCDYFFGVFFAGINEAVPKLRAGEPGRGIGQTSPAVVSGRACRGVLWEHFCR